MMQYLDHVEGQVSLGETKAAQLLAADSLLLAALVIFASDIDVASTGTAVLAGVAAVLLAGSIYMVLIAVTPGQGHLISGRLWQNSLWTRALRQTARAGATEPGVVNFIDVSGVPVEVYVDAARRRTTHDLEGDILRAIHGKATWLSRRLSWLDRAVKLTLGGLATALVAGAVELLSRWA
jgi:hypothetical protein